MTTFERRQRILQLLSEQNVVKVVELAERYDVSEGTIRNDLAALEEEGLLMRVRGGAARIQTPPSFDNIRVTRKAINVEAKRRIARWAADMVEDGDAIALDASSTVLYMIPSLAQFRRLTIITTGIETARLAVESTPHTVILVGGVIGANANSVTGLLAAPMLQDLHFRTAFVSGVGLSAQHGLTERDLAEAQLKRTLVEHAQQTVALVDSSKFERVGLAPCLPISKLSNVYTDSQAAPDTIQQLCQQGVTVTVCGERTVTTHRNDSRQPNYRIGFANLTESDIAFAIDVRRGLERAAEAKGVQLVLADNQLSGEQALRVADYLIEKKVDLVIEYQIDAAVSSLIMDKFSRAGIPVIAVDIPMVGANFFGADNYRSGHIAGLELGRWIQECWDGELDLLLILEERRAGDLPASRIVGQIEGVQQMLGTIPAEKRIYLDSGNTSRTSDINLSEALQNNRQARRIAVLAFNDDAAFGALQAARRLGRESDVAIIGQGCDRIIRAELRKRGACVVGSTAFMPERYGDRLIELALQILEGKPVPPAVYMDHVFITAANIDEYYAA
ncbi:MAG: substrate-binding domain-containing protein [Caldilineales bacterium]|nr:substrate-binding domain-containing protein [Caldilineales bacterium]